MGDDWYLIETGEAGQEEQGHIMPTLQQAGIKGLSCHSDIESQSGKRQEKRHLEDAAAS